MTRDYLVLVFVFFVLFSLSLVAELIPEIVVPAARLPIPPALKAET